MVGIVAGCWSSVCIAGPLWHLLRSKIDKVAPAKENTGSGSGSAGTSSKKKQGGSNLSKRERKRLKQKEIEERNKAKTVV
jgi:hypothetical protein